MNILIFGATGGTGRQLTAQALQQGYQISVFCRRPEAALSFHKAIRIIQGDALNSTQVATAIQGQDAVFCALGMPNVMDGSLLRSRASTIIVKGMEQAGVKRLVCLSALGAGDSRTLLPAHYRYVLQPVIMRRLYTDHNLQEAAIIRSRLDWTIIRPAILTDGPHTGNYRHGTALRKQAIKHNISRADTAEFMLRQLSDERYIHAAPVIATARGSVDLKKDQH